MNGRVILVAAVGGASDSKAAAAALACAGSEPDRPGLLIDVGGRVPRPTLVSSSAARELEERLVVHLPQLRAAARGQTCHLAVGDDPGAFESIRAALPLVRESTAVVHLSPVRLRGTLGEAGIRATGVLLRADLDTDRALVALAVRDLLRHDLRIKVLKRPLSWVSARRALFGVPASAAAGRLTSSFHRSLLESQISAVHTSAAGKPEPPALPL
jgi:hypothetical protein